MESDRVIVQINPDESLPVPARRLHRLWRWFKQARGDPGACRARRVVLLLLLLWVVSAFDLVFTLLAVRAGVFVEINPIAAPLLNNPGLLVTFKVLAVLFASIIIFKFRRRFLTEIGCWGLCLIYTLLSARWWIYHFAHH